MPILPETANLGEAIYTFFAIVLVITSLINGYIKWTRGRRSQRKIDGWSGAPIIVFWEKIALAFIFTMSGALFTFLGIVAMLTPDNPAPSAELSRLIAAIGFTGMELSFTAYQVALLLLRPIIDHDLDGRQIIVMRLDLQGAPPEKEA